MRSASLTVGLSSQNPRRGGARILQRLAGAVGSLLSGSAVLGRTRRRPAAASPTAPDTAARPAVKRPRASRRSRVAPPPHAPTRPGWIARLIRRRPPPDAPTIAPPSPPGEDEEAYPGLSPEARAILNTPAKDLDPEILSLLLSGVARHIAANLPPELGMDARAVFAKLAGRLGMEVRPGPAEPTPAESPQPEPAATQDHATQVLPAAAAARLAPKPQVPADRDALPRAITPVFARDRQAARTLKTVDRSRRFVPRRRRTWGNARIARFPRTAVYLQDPSPPARRLTYAACAGPP